MSLLIRQVLREFVLEARIIQTNYLKFGFGVLIMLGLGVVFTRIDFFQLSTEDISLQNYHFISWWFGFVIGLSQLGSEITRVLEEGTVLYWKNMSARFFGVFLAKVITSALIALCISLIFLILWLGISQGSPASTVFSVFSGLIAGFVLSGFYALTSLLGRHGHVYATIATLVVLLAVRNYIRYYTGDVFIGLVGLSLFSEFSMVAIFREITQFLVISSVGFVLLFYSLKKSLSSGYIVSGWRY